MPGPQDLMALLQNVGAGTPAPGGAPPMPPQGGPPMPPQGGAPPMGGGIAQILGQLMQNPAAMKGMQQYMQQMGGGAPMMSGPGAAQGGPPPGPADIPQGSPPPGMEPPSGAPGADQKMVSDEIDRKGATWDGVDAPTQNDIERLQAEPTPINIKSFDDQFGEGTAEKIIGEEGGEGGGEEEGQGEPPPADKGEPPDEAA